MVDSEELLARLDRDPEFRLFRIETLGSVADLTRLARYAVGDLIRVPRSDGRCSLGVVARIDEAGLRVVLRDNGGNVSHKDLTPAHVSRYNALKIGDVLRLGADRFWVTGIDHLGELVIRSDSGERVDPENVLELVDRKLSDPEVTLPVTAVGVGVQKAAAPQDDETIPLVSVREARPRSGMYTPIESLHDAQNAVGLVAGNMETDTVFGIRSAVAGAALHTDRGKNYKPWNEDGGVLFGDRRGRMYVGVFDQAGGEGGDAEFHGAASLVSAQAFFEEMRALATEEEADVEHALVASVHRAHHAILARGHGEVTTFVAGRIDANEAVLVNVGDSGARLYDERGALLEMTFAQGFGRVLLEGVGMTRKALPRHQTYRWKVYPGDFLVLGSDGLFDSRLPDERIGQIVARAGTPKAATRELRDLVRARMEARTGKPDNLTVLVVRVGDSSWV